MLTLKQGELAIKLARKAIESVFENKKIPEIKDKLFSEKRGVFVTLNSYPNKELRGCIGFPYPIMQFKEAIIEAAKSAAFEDLRFTQIQKKELDNVIIEISILSVPKKIENKNKDIVKNIKIGKDGLICNYGNNSGLLLPQVASEYKWTVLQFLQNTCQKAGLSKDAWKDEKYIFYKFQAQIFCEETPNGKVNEKQDILWKKAKPFQEKR